MKLRHTHYDNLKVARNAPPEVIRAAYKTLAQMFHPDRNPGDPRAARIMVIINAAYEVLSDAGKRAEYDRWIASQEVSTPDNHPPPKNQWADRRPPPWKPNVAKAGSIPAAVKVLSVLAFVGFIAWSAATDSNKPSSAPKGYQRTPPTLRPVYVKPTTAPNGQEWPKTPGYIKGYQILNANGLSTVTVDNTRNDSDVFVKLVAIGGERSYPVRQFYIPAQGSFRLNKVTSGYYDVRYRDLTSGNLSRSESFKLDEIRTDSGIKYSNITMTLYKVINGNMQTYGLTEAEF